MRKFYFLRRSIYSTFNSSYDPREEDWKPENHENFSMFLFSADVCRDNSLTPEEFLACLVDYRSFCVRNRIPKVPLNESFFLWNLEEALELYLQDRRLFYGTHSSTESKIVDPEEVRLKQLELQEYTWNLLREDMETDLDTLKKIYCFGIQNQFYSEFLQERGLPEMIRLGIQEGWLELEKGVYQWKH
jgi:hypothetical protein